MKQFTSRDGRIIERRSQVEKFINYKDATIKDFVYMDVGYDKIVDKIYSTKSLIRQLSMRNTTEDDKFYLYNSLASSWNSTHNYRFTSDNIKEDLQLLEEEKQVLEERYYKECISETKRDVMHSIYPTKPIHDVRLHMIYRMGFDYSVLPLYEEGLKSKDEVVHEEVISFKTTPITNKTKNRKKEIEEQYHKQIIQTAKYLEDKIKTCGYEKVRVDGILNNVKEYMANDEVEDIELFAIYQFIKTK